MTRWLRQAYSPAILLTAWLAAWGLAGLLLLSSLAVPGLFDDREFRQQIVATTGIILTLFAGYRGMSNHPISNPLYATWLARTPWVPSDPLPLGRVLLGWQDLFAAIVLVAPMSLIDSTRVWILLQLLVGVYLLTLTFQVATSGQKGWTFLALIGLGGMVLAIQSPAVYFLIAVAVYLSLVFGFRRSLPRFTWRESVESQGDLGWPYQLIGPVPSDATTPWREGIAYGVLFGWAAFIFGWYGDYEDRSGNNSVRVTTWLVPVAVTLAAAARVLWYILGHLPRINLFGRIASGQVVLPNYDVVFLAPLAAVAVAVLVPSALLFLGTPSPVSAAVGASIAGALLASAGPSRGTWRLTAPARLSIVFTQTQQPLTRTTNR